LTLCAYVAHHPVIPAGIVVDVDSAELGTAESSLTHTAFHGALTVLHRIPSKIEAVRVTGPSVWGVDLSRSNGAVIKINGARKLMQLPVTRDGECADYPVTTARVVIQPHVSEIDVRCAVALYRAFADLIPASLDRLSRSESVAAAEARTAVNRAALGKVASSIIGAIIGATPHDVERVTFCSAGRILDSDYRSAVSGITDKVLTASPVDSLEAEAGRIIRQDTVAFKPSPLRGLPRDVPHQTGLPANLYFRNAINHHLYGAFAIIVVAAPRDVSAALRYLLSACARDQ